MRGARPSWARVAGAPARALIDLIWPERCLLCGAGSGEAPWTAAGPRVPGLRPWDLPHLCAPCGAGLGGRPRLCAVPLEGDVSLAVAAGGGESPELVALTGALKYHGVRGAAWGLAAVAAPAAALLPPAAAGAVLVPVPLHAARRRERGFNQAELLARLLGEELGRPVAAEIVRRSRATSQQAKVASSAAARRANVAGAFAAAPAPAGAPAVMLVDDLATSGQTLAAVARALGGAGWAVAGALVAGAGTACGGANAA